MYTGIILDLYNYILFIHTLFIYGIIHCDLSLLNILDIFNCFTLIQDVELVRCFTVMFYGMLLRIDG